MSDSDSGSMGRARARSRTMEGNDLAAELDILAGGDGSIGGTSPGGSSSGGGGSGGQGRSRSGSGSSGGSAGSGTSSELSAGARPVSSRTRKILTLEEYSGSRPPVGVGGSGLGGFGGVGVGSGGEGDEDLLMEEELRELEELERRKAAAARATGSAAASASASSGSAVAGGSTGSSGGAGHHHHSHGGSGGASAGGDASSGAAAIGAAAAAAAARGAPLDISKAKMKGKDKPAFDLHIKLLMLGDGGVGKTSLLTRYAEDKFVPGLLATAGVAFQTQYITVEGRTIRLDIWDTAGQERFHVITQAYYAGAHGIILVYDVSDKDETSFNNVRYWMENIRKHASPHCAKLLLGNKVDMKGRKVTTERGQAVADEYGVGFFETSAKSGLNVTESFHSIARDCVLRALAAEGVDVAAAEKTAADAATKDGKKCVVM